MIRTHIGYIHEFHPNFNSKTWVAKEDFDSDNPAALKDLQAWAAGLAEPWSETSVSYVVNFKDDIRLWEARYISIFYDCLESIALGYGDTPEAAVVAVKKIVEESIEKFYNEGEEKPQPIITQAAIDKYREETGLNKALKESQ